MARPKKGEPALTEDVRAKLSASRDLPTQTEFVQELFRLAGGPKALAVMVWTEFQKQSSGPQLRGKILELLVRCLESLEKAADPRRYVAELSDEELEAFVDERIKKLVTPEGAGADGGQG